MNAVIQPITPTEAPALNMVECHRCGGSGDMPKFRHVQGGTCFKCNGTGTVLFRPSEFFNPQICDSIHHLTMSNDGYLWHIQICVWDEGTGKEKAGTANISSQQWTLRVTESSQMREDHGTAEGVSLAHARQYFQEMQSFGYDHLTGDALIDFLDWSDRL